MREKHNETHGLFKWANNSENTKSVTNWTEKMAATVNIWSDCYVKFYPKYMAATVILWSDYCINIFSNITLIEFNIYSLVIGLSLKISALVSWKKICLKNKTQTILMKINIATWLITKPGEAPISSELQ